MSSETDSQGSVVLVHWIVYFSGASCMYLALMTSLKVILDCIVEARKPEMSLDLSFNCILSCMRVTASY